MLCPVADRLILKGKRNASRIAVFLNRAALMIAADAPSGERMAATTTSVSKTILTSYTISHGWDVKLIQGNFGEGNRCGRRRPAGSSLRLGASQLPSGAPS